MEGLAKGVTIGHTQTLSPCGCPNCYARLASLVPTKPGNVPDHEINQPVRPTHLVSTCGHCGELLKLDGNKLVRVTAEDVAELKKRDEQWQLIKVAIEFGRSSGSGHGAKVMNRPCTPWDKE